MTAWKCGASWFYIRDPGASVFHAIGLLVVSLAGNRICAMTM